jgi:hypothetical protein
LWLGYNAELEWDNVVLKDLHLELAAILPVENYRDRAMQILYPGTSTTSQKKKAYLAAILPRYIPFGIVPEWIREVPVASRIGLRTGSFVVKSGWVLNTDKAARMGLRTAGITAIRGDIVRTPTASRFGLRTSFHGITKDPGTATRLGLRTGSFTHSTYLSPIINAANIGYDNNDTAPTETYATIYGLAEDYGSLVDMLDGVTSYTGGGVGDVSNTGYTDAVAVEFSVATKIDTIDIFFDRTDNTPPDGLYGGADKLEVYYSTGGDWTLLEQFPDIVREDYKVRLTITSPVTAKYYKVRAYDSHLRSAAPVIQLLLWCELQFRATKEVT